MAFGKFGTKPQEEEVVKQAIQEKEEVKTITMTPQELDDLLDAKLKKAMASLPQQEVQVSRRESNREFGISDAIEGLPEVEYVDRWYTTIGEIKPATSGIRNRHKKSSPLQWRNPVTKQIHTLKYASNQTTFIAEFQKGDVLIQSIVITDGRLFVPKENILLQQFLAVHPDLELRFIEINKSKDAQKEVSKIEVEAKALGLAVNMEYFKLKSIAMVGIEGYSSSMSTSEVKESIYKFAKNNPTKFIQLANDESLELKALIKTAIERGLITVKDRDYMNSKGEVMFSATYNGDVLEEFSNYLKTDDEGRDMHSYLKNAIA